MDSTMEKSENNPLSGNKKIPTVVIKIPHWEQENTHDDNIGSTMGTGEYPQW